MLKALLARTQEQVCSSRCRALRLGRGHNGARWTLECRVQVSLVLDDIQYPNFTEDNRTWLKEQVQSGPDWKSLAETFSKIFQGWEGRVADAVAGCTLTSRAAASLFRLSSDLIPIVVSALAAGRLHPDTATAESMVLQFPGAHTPSDVRAFTQGLQELSKLPSSCI